ncbi:MAG TPA: glycosyl hydrolase family 65 protein [Victivallales bacterium]|nr:glycosyl hydrolase family 65 protein [Victivallales bacterium]
MMSEWSITENLNSINDFIAYEGLFTQGSGYLHVRGSLEEIIDNSKQNETYLRIPGNVTVEEFNLSKNKWGTYVPGVFANHPLLNNEMVNLPYFIGLSLKCEGEIFDIENSAFEHYERKFNLQNGLITRKFRWITKSGCKISIHFERFISSAYKHICFQKLCIASDKKCNIEIESFIDADIRTSGYDHLKKTCFKHHGNYSLACKTVTDSNIIVNLLSKLLLDSKYKTEFVKGPRKASLKLNISCNSGQKIVIEKRTAVCTNIDLDKSNTANILKNAENLTYKAHLDLHNKCWTKRWKTCDIKITGDTKSQLSLRISLYHLLRCHVPEDNRVTIDAKGYAGDAYFGRFFWDTEIYMLPFYLYTDPDRARTFAEFRIQSLNGAKKNAELYGYKGARYPWESDPDGNECCPLANWQYRDHEVHVTADVIYGLAHYAKAVNNENFINTDSAELIMETARYWIDRIDFNREKNIPELLGVMGPDEYTAISNNNSYTNRLVAFNLQTAVKTGKCTEEEEKLFTETAEKLSILKKSNLVLQCEFFTDKAEPDFENDWKDKTKPFGANVHQEKLYRTKCLKQADVLMLMYLFPDEFTIEELETAWNYYLPYTTHDSSLSYGIHAILALKLGKRDTAWEYWKKTSGLDLDFANGGASRGIHIANAAANWQVAVFGFAGIKTTMETNILHLGPNLPDKWKKISFPLIWKGQNVYIEITHSILTVENRSCKKLYVSIFENHDTIHSGQKLSVKF